jgi:hypothetical protein
MLRVSPVCILLGPGDQETERTTMGIAAVAEDLSGLDELEEIVRLDASENDPEDDEDDDEDEDEDDEDFDEDEDEDDDSDDDDDEDDEDDGEGVKPEGMPYD